VTAPKAAVWVAALLLATCLFSHTIALRLLLLALGIVLAATLLARNRELRALPPIWIPFALWAAWAALSLAWSLEPERTIKEWRSEVFYAGATLWVCFVAAQARETARIFLPIIGGAAIIACVFALDLFLRGGDRNLGGWHGGAGHHSSALLMLTPCAIMTAWYARRRGWRTVMLAAAGTTALFLASAYATLNRTVWLGLAVEFALIASLVLLRSASPRQGTRRIFALFAVVLTLGAGAAVHTIQADQGGRPLEQDTRLFLWPEVLKMSAERPLTGYGFGRGILRESLQEELRAVDSQLWHAHNLFLDTVLQLGVPGLLLFVLLLGAIVRQGWRLARNTPDEVVAAGVALIAVLGGVAVRNLTDTLLVRQNALLFWGLIGVLLASSCASAPETRPPSRS
jgi:O-antigen ligase